jgi:hypothetical protein
MSKKNPDQGKLKSLSDLKGMTPNTMQRRPDAPKHSPPKPFNLYKTQGK